MPKKLGLVTSLGFFLLVIHLYLIFEANFVYGEVNGPVVRDQLITLLLLQASVMAAFRSKLPTLETSIFDVWKFSLVFIVSTLVFLFIPKSDVLGIVGNITFVAVGYGIFHSFVVAYSEELVFRGLIPMYFGNVVSLFGYALLFGLFHIGKPGYSLLNIIGLTLLLGIPAFIIKNFRYNKKGDTLGILGAVGFHLAFNMRVFGVTDILINNIMS